MLLADSNKEFAFDKTTTASCIFYTKTFWFPDFIYAVQPPAKTEATQQVNSTTAFFFLFFSAVQKCAVKTMGTKTAGRTKIINTVCFVFFLLCIDLNVMNALKLMMSFRQVQVAILPFVDIRVCLIIILKWKRILRWSANLMNYCSRLLLLIIKTYFINIQGCHASNNEGFGEGYFQHAS